MTLRVARGGFALQTYVDGDAGKPWLVLSNSLGSNASMWDPQIPFLTDRYRVLRYDTRGHGQSDAPDGPYSFPDLLADVIAVMDHHQIAQADFMGLSLGGMTGLGLALHHPDRITRVVCADARADAPAPIQEMWDTRIAAVQNGGLEAVVEGTLASWLTQDWRDANPEGSDAIRAMVLGNTTTGYIGCCQALRTLDYLRDLPKVTIPVLFVGGKEDKGAAPEVMQAMAEATPGGRYRSIPGAAHVANINSPALFNASISDFLTGILTP